MRSTVRSSLPLVTVAASAALLLSGCAPTDYFDEAGDAAPSASAAGTQSAAPDSAGNDSAASDTGGDSSSTDTPGSSASTSDSGAALTITSASDAHFTDRVGTSEIYAAEPTDSANTMLVVKLTLESRSDQPQDLRAEFTLRPADQPDIACLSDGKPGAKHPGLQGITIQPGQTREGWVYCEVPTAEDLRGARLAVHDDGAGLAQSLELTLPRM